MSQMTTALSKRMKIVNGVLKVLVFSCHIFLRIKRIVCIELELC